jgi:sugar lactone lactonase YvrE
LLINFQSPGAPGKIKQKEEHTGFVRRSLPMPELQTLLTGLAFGESPRWHDRRLWVADWGAQEILAVTLEGKSEVIVTVSFPSFPLCFDWLPTGHFLLVSSREGRLRMESGGELVTHADLSGLAKSGHPWNEIVTTGEATLISTTRALTFPAASSLLGRSLCSRPTGPLARWPMASLSPTAWR